MSVDWTHTCVAASREDAIQHLLRQRPRMRIVACYQMQAPTCWFPRTGQLDFFSWLGVCCPRLRTWRVLAKEG